MRKSGRSALKAKQEQLIRNFHENGMKLMLENPRNVQELLAIAGTSFGELIDFDRMRLVKRSFVKRDFRHIESDVVLTAPLHRVKGQRVRRAIVYVLIEHQSEPDRLMLLRALDYVVQIFNFQVREWSKAHESLRGVRLQPVLPLVFYTGERRWASLGRLSDLVERQEAFEPVLPAMAPIFLSLRDMPAARLETEGGLFGWLLRLVQDRKTRPQEFQRLLRNIVTRLEEMSSQERMRWLELLSYVHALIYHERDAEEIPALQETIEASVATDEYRREVFAMGKSYAQVLIERGHAQGLEKGLEKGREEGLEKGLEKGREKGREEAAVQTRQEMLYRLLSKRFGDLPKEISKRVLSTNDTAQLDAWLENFANAKKLADVGILAEN